MQKLSLVSCLYLFLVGVIVYLALARYDGGMEWLTALDPTGEIILMVTAIALGSFVGLRREIEMQEQGVPGFVGFRTMPLITLLGCLSTFFPLFPYMPVVAFVAVIGFLAIAYYNGVFQLQLLGLTSELATLIMFLVGVLVGYGHVVQGILVAVMVASLTAFKGQMHSFARTISSSEWVGALQLLIISALVLPILPRYALDPWEVFVPYDIWLVVIFISALGFVGYFLNKYVGERKGLITTSIVGSLVSSTVVTTHLAHQGQAGHAHRHDVLMLGMVVAITTMLLRVLVVLVVLTPSEYLMSVVLVPLVMLLVTSCCALYWYGRSQDEIEQEEGQEAKIPPLQSPFDLIPALKFAALFLVVLLAVQLGQTYFGKYGVVATTFFSAFADVDASIVSVLQTLRSGGMEMGLVVLVIAVAIIVNTLVKALYVWLISKNRRLSLNVLWVTLGASVAGIIALVFV